MAYLTPPPDPVPRTPSFPVPAGAWDCHFHLFGPADRYPFDPASPYVSADALPETLIELQETLGLGNGVIVSGGGYGRTYRHLLDTLRRFPGRFRGVMLPPPAIADEELAVLHDAGVRGVRFVSPGHAPNLPHLDPELAARISAHGWHVDFYPHGADITAFAEPLLALPTPIVLDHFGGVPAAGGTDQPAFATLLRLLDTGRVWVKLSGPMRCTAEDFPYASVAPLAAALVRHAPERLIWGSDWPHVNMRGRAMPNDGDLLGLLADWVPDAGIRKRILVDNPEALFRPA